MSADNWTQCPRCQVDDESRQDALIKIANDAYGRVSPDEYEIARQNALHPDFEEDTFREDYEFYGAELGVVRYTYSGECTVCGLEVEFNGEHRFYDTANRHEVSNGKT